MSAPVVRPCPFCAGVAQLNVTWCWGWNHELHRSAKMLQARVVCNSCNATGPWPRGEGCQHEAVKAWNRPAERLSEALNGQQW